MLALFATHVEHPSHLTYLLLFFFQHARHSCVVHFPWSSLPSLDFLSTICESYRLLLLRQLFQPFCHCHVLVRADDDGCTCSQLLSSCHKDLHLLPGDFAASIHLLTGAPVFELPISTLPFCFVDSLCRLSCLFSQCFPTCSPHLPR